MIGTVVAVVVVEVVCGTRGGRACVCKCVCVCVCVWWGWGGVGG